MVRKSYRPNLDVLGPEHNGVRMSLREFERAEAARGYRFELVEGALQVAPAPNPREKSIAVALYDALRAYSRWPGLVIDLSRLER